MKDVAAMADDRGLAIQRVGLRKLHLPLLVLRKEGGYQPVLTELDIAADLSREERGSHLSRFVEILNEWRERAISEREMEAALHLVRERLQASSAQLELRFKYFIEKTAPISGSKSLLDYNTLFSASLSEDGFDFVLGVEVPSVSVCPCSKEISDYGAHGQRGNVRARIRYSSEIFWLEDLVHLVEAELSAPVYPLLKREDEKFITECSYERAKFVEDVARDVVLALKSRPEITWFEVECEHFESIHHHSAYAFHSEQVGEANEQD